MTSCKADNRSIKYFLKRLNSFLEAEDMKLTAFDRTLKRFTNRFDPKIAIINFKYFDERRLKKVRREIEKQERLKNYNYLRNLRNLEQVCLNYIELREFFRYEKSKFLYDNNYLLFCYCGTSKNERQILNLISTDDRYVELKLKDFEED